MLPITCLEAFLISKKLKPWDCQPLLDAISSRISSWKSKCLSYADRLPLINSTLIGRLLYWFNIFRIPTADKDKLEQMLCRFLWTGSNVGLPRAKVSWQKVTIPKKEGGLGIRKLAKCNTTNLMKHLWRIASSKKTLCVL